MLVAVVMAGCHAAPKPSPQLQPSPIPSPSPNPKPSPSPCPTAASELTRRLIGVLSDQAFLDLATAPIAEPLEIRITEVNGASATFQVPTRAEFAACLNAECASIGDALWGSWQLAADQVGTPAAITCAPADTRGRACCAVDAVSFADYGLMLDQVCVAGGAVVRLDVTRDGV